MKRWTVEDDVALVAAVTHVCDLKAKKGGMNCCMTRVLADLLENGWMLWAGTNSEPSNPESPSLLRRMNNAQMPVTNASLIAQLFFDKILEQNRTVFHHSRSAKVLEEHWRELKYYGLVVDQKPVIFEDDLLQMEKTFDMVTLVEGDGSLPLDIEERHTTRNLVVNEREAGEWEKVFVKAVTGIYPHTQMSPETMVCCVVAQSPLTFARRRHSSAGPLDVTKLM
uniref:Microspherule protein N-terminal domain-containing protein n=1 Tax=Ditylenchus dipsaci TaxID=166011 RepID=A0A915E9S5_9BILA